MNSRKSSASSNNHDSAKAKTSKSIKPDSSSSRKYLEKPNQKKPNGLDNENESTKERYYQMMSKLNETSLKSSPDLNLNINGSTLSVKSNDLSNLINPAKDLDKKNKSDGSSDDDEPVIRKAPNELLEEFLVYVMQKNWKDAHKLCKFILMYEPNNETAKEFLPLIERKLEITESDTSSEESDNDDEDDGEDSDEESDSDQSDSDTDSDDSEEGDKDSEKSKSQLPKNDIKSIKTSKLNGNIK